MEESAWFREVSLGGAPASARDILDALVAMLDEVRPEALDRARSYVTTTGHEWREYHVEFLLAHTDEESDITVAVGANEAFVSWLMAHEHVYPEDGTTERPWTTVVIDAVAALLRGEYGVTDHCRGDRLVKTTIHDTLLGGKHISTSGSLLGLLPFLRRVDRVEHRTVDFRCRG